MVQVNIPRLSSVYASLDTVRPLTHVPAFFLLVFAFSIPFWVTDGATSPGAGLPSGAYMR